MARTITAFFDSQTDAQRAQQQLLSLGLTDDDVRLVNQSTRGQGADDDKGLWESIKDFFVPDEDRSTYTEGLRRGGYLLTARVSDEHTDEAIDILERSEAVDLDTRSEQWRNEGWTGTQAVGAAHDMSTSPTVGAYADQTSAQSERRTDRMDQGADRLASSVDDREEAIPIVHERLKIGKREVNRGGVRVRSYIVEEPVNERVELREERVDVERRPVNQGVGDASDLLRERTIEVSETAEEAVVAKEAEVTEELVVRKFEGVRTEGVSDTVRHTEVEVDDTRTDETATPRPDTGRRRGKSDQPRRQ